MKYHTGQIKNSQEIIMELSKQKCLQRYTTSFEPDFIQFERQPQSDQLSDIFTPPMKVLFYTLQISDIEINAFQ